MKPNNNNQSPKRKPIGCLTVFVILFAIFAAIGISMSLTMDNVTTKGIKKYIDVSDEQGSAIDTILSECGINDLKSVSHDELLDNAHIEGEKGYRLSTKDADNIILYISPDMNVNQIRYNDYDLYANGSKIAALQDYVVSIDDVNKYQYLCQEKIKELLKSPDTATFPNYTEWGWKKELNTLTVQGYVNAKNDFNADVKSDFQFTIDISNDTITSLIFDNSKII